MLVDVEVEKVVVVVSVEKEAVVVEKEEMEVAEVVDYCCYYLN